MPRKLPPVGLLPCLLATLLFCCHVADASATASPDPVAQAVAWDADGTWSFEPGDRLEGGPLDLRRLNEQVAGESGFVRLSGDGNGYLRGDGVPLRFWGVAAHVNPKVGDEELARHARFLARMGVNAVRVGGASSGLIPQDEGAAITDVNEEFLNDVWRTVAAMRKQGIYTRISPFWDHGAVKYINDDWGIEGYSSGDRLNALLFFEPNLQKGFRAWMRRLLTEVNPYTGVAIKDDPSVAIIQVVSEDSIFFWWTQNIKGGPLRELEQRFGEFARQKYSSIEQAIRTWEGTRLERDAAGQGRLGLYPLYNLTLWPGQGHPVRLRDQVEFFAQLERDFYAEMKRYLQDELGARQLIGASNFGPAEPVRLLGAQRWAWMAGDVMEKNDFYSTDLKGPNVAWRIEAGHTFKPRSATLVPDIPGLRKHVVGRPFNVSSTNWVPPSPYSAEGPVVTAAYGSMNGVDGFYWFAAQAPVYELSPHMPWATVKGSHPLARWSISHPGFISQFPAAALIHRLGLIDQAPTVVHEERSADEVFARNAPLLTEDLDYAPVQHVDEAVAQKQHLMRRAAPEAYLVGRVEVVYGGEPARSRVADLSEHIAADGSLVRSAHGQLTLNRAAGVLTIDAPAAQGVVGFLKNAGGRFETADLAIESSNGFASVVAVALDGNPLRSSGRVLVQVGTMSAPTGWEVVPASDGQGSKRVEIASTGQVPWRVADTHGVLSIRNAVLSGAIRLDAMGFAAEAIPAEQDADVLRVRLPRKTMYAILTAK